MAGSRAGSRWRAAVTGGGALALAVGLAVTGGAARAGVPGENRDDAPAGAAVPLACRPHPRAGGARLCQGFVLARPGLRGFDAALDVDLAVPAGPGPHPLVVQVHGWGGDKGTPAGDAPFLGAGLALLRYSARGFGASHGDTQLADEDVEIRDLQDLVRQGVEGTAFAAPPGFALDRRRIAVAGTSYGGAHALLAAQTDRRTWPCRPDACRIVTAVAIATWTDLAYSLVPNGRPASRVGDPGYVVGVPKASYVTALFGLGARAHPRHGGPNYAPFFPAWLAAFGAGEPYQDPRTLALDPVRAPVLAEGLRAMAADRSAAYQDYCSAGPVPLLVAQGWTDDLFTAHEVVRLRDVLDRQCRGDYPLKVYLGNAGHPRARLDDPGEAAYLRGVVLAWLRHHLRGEGPRPAYDVTAAVTPPPGGRFDPASLRRAPDIEALATGRVRLDLPGGARLAASPDPALASGPAADPVLGFATGGRAARVPAAGAAATWRLPLPPLTLCGAGTVRLRGTVAGSDAAYTARLWDVDGAGRRTLVDRGVTRWLGSPGRFEIAVPLHGNLWRLRPGHSLVLEVATTDAPYLRPSNLASVTVLEGAGLDLPAC